MPEGSKRLRVLAGPNGSGKSTVIKKLRSRYYCGYFVNADEIDSLLDTKRVLNLNAEYGLNVHLDAFSEFLSGEGKSWMDKAYSEGLPVNLIFYENNLLIAKNNAIGKYDAAIAADFVRHQLLAQNNTFTFETVLSHTSKIQFLQKARDFGYKNYLYFVCTVDPAINISRVDQRVTLKGHGVPQSKIVNRYHASLALLPSLIPLTYRTFLFDNSAENSEIKLVGELEGDNTFIPRTEQMPWWVYEHVIDPIFSKG